MKVVICLLLCICALQVGFSTASQGRSFDSFRRGGHGGGRGNRCGPHHGRGKFSRHGPGQDSCVDDNQDGNINDIGNFGPSSPPTEIRRPEYNWNGYEDTSSPSNGIRRPEYNGNRRPTLPSTGVQRPEYNGYEDTSSPSNGIRRPEYNGNLRPTSPSTGVQRPEYNGNVGPSSPSTGVRGPEYSRNDNAEASSPPTGLIGPASNANGTDSPRRIIQVGSNCPPGYRGDTRGHCREDI